MTEERFEQIGDLLRAPLKDAVNSVEISLGILLETYEGVFQGLDYVQGVYASYSYDPRKHAGNPIILSVRVTNMQRQGLQWGEDYRQLDALVRELGNQIINLGCRADVKAVPSVCVPKGYVKLWERQTPDQI